MRSHGLRIAFFGASLVSARWNGAVMYYRGLLKALHARGHQITFYEPALPAATARATSAMAIGCPEQTL